MFAFREVVAIARPQEVFYALAQVGSRVAADDRAAISSHTPRMQGSVPLSPPHLKLGWVFTNRGGQVNKGQLIEGVARDAGLSKTDAGRALDALLGTVEQTLRRGDDVSIMGFGKFSVTRREARTGRNPQTGETVRIEASNTPKFSAGASLKQAVNGGR